MKLNFTPHAKVAQIERGMSDFEVKETIIKGSKVRQKPDKLRAEKGPWAVAFKKSKKIQDKFIIITVIARWE